MSTALDVARIAVAVAVAGCAGSGTGSVVPGDLLLTADQSTVGLSPGQTGSVGFVLTAGGVPFPGQKVTFAIVDPTTAGNATLPSATTVTDQNGAAVARIHAMSEAQFRLRASFGLTEAEALVVVATGPFGTVVVAPFFAPTSTTAALAKTIEVLFYDGHHCRDIVPAQGSGWTRRDPPLPTSGGTASFEDVATEGTSAVVARALDRQQAPTAAGCVDLYGSTLLPGGVVQVALPLYDTVPDPVGSYDATSKLKFSPPLPAAGAIAAPWRDLADCPLDPAQIWLDCTIDALSPATPDDPLDCVPASSPGAEGPVGDALIARRGVPIANPTGTMSGCRDARDAHGAVSLDAVVLGLYGSPLPAPIVSLPDIGHDAAHILDFLILTSTIDVSPGDRSDHFLVTHTLVNGTFQWFGTKGGDMDLRQADQSLQPLGLPVLSAQASATTQDGQIFITNHGFTLRLGTVARAAFGTAVLAPRGLPPNPADVPAALAALAHLDDGVTSGCEAMDQTLCPLVGLAAGCLTGACNDGLAALAAQLAASFDPADGSELDLHLAGSAVLRDATGSGTTHQLGDSDDQSKLAAWSVDLRTRLGRSLLGARFSAARH